MKCSFGLLAMGACGCWRGHHPGCRRQDWRLYLLAIAFSLGDEMLHVISDENALGQKINDVRFYDQHYDAELLGNYQRHYMKQAKSVADSLRWRPRDIG